MAVPLLVCVTMVACNWALVSASPLQAQECGIACGKYYTWGYNCAQQAGCFQMAEDLEDVCVRNCTSAFTHCLTLCGHNYGDMMNSCMESCQDASIMDVFCEEDCFQDLFNTKYSQQLPELPPEDFEQEEQIAESDEEDSLDKDDLDVMSDE